MKRYASTVIVPFLVLAGTFAILAGVNLFFASRTLPGDGIRYVFTFLGGLFTIATFSALTKAIVREFE